MADDTEFSEEYIAELLKKDAQKVSASYAKNGIYDVLPKRPIGTAPKPNTRFLKNIIRSTDSHNAALKQKELGDAAHRLRALARKEDSSSHVHSQERDTAYRSRHQERGQYKRKRDYERDDSKDEHSYARKRSRSRHRSLDRDERYSDRRRREIDKHANHESHKRHRGKHRDDHYIGANNDRSEDSGYSTNSSITTRLTKHSAKKTKKRKSSSTVDSDDGDRSRSRTRERHSNHDRNKRRHAGQTRSRSRSNRRRHRDTRVHVKHTRNLAHASSESRSSDSDSRSRRKKSSRSRSHDKHTHLRHEDSQPTKYQKSPEPLPPPDKDLSDDDPLTSFLGPPLPPKTRSLVPKVRGRGATSFASGTEARFSTSYDPQNDINIDIVSETEDWDQALEALRDRQKFRKAGADRLLAAGFTKEEVARIERGGEKDESDVRWTKRGQAREWDRGKTVDENGDVAVSAEGFGRLV